LRDHKAQYQKRLQQHPNFVRDKYQRLLELHPNIGKEKYQRLLELHPEFQRRFFRFKNKRIYLGFKVRIDVCSKCKKSILKNEIRQTDLHHDIYDWNNILANTRELCSSCHSKFHHARKRSKIPEINKPKTESEWKIWNEISWSNFYVSQPTYHSGIPYEKLHLF